MPLPPAAVSTTCVPGQLHIRASARRGASHHSRVRRPTFQNSHDLENVTHLQDWEQIEIANIRKFRPAVIIIDDWAVNGTEESRFSRWATQLTKFIENHYRLVASVNSKRAFALLTPGV